MTGSKDAHSASHRRVNAGRSLDGDMVIDLSGIFGALWVAKWRLLFASLIVAGLTFALVQSMSPRFRADAQVFVESRDVQVTRSRDSAGEVESTRTALDAEGVASVAQLIGSRDNVLQVVRDFGLMDRPEFNPALESGIVQDLLALAGLADPMEEFAEERTLQEVQKALSISPVGDSRIISIAFASKDRSLAAQVPNALVQVFLSGQTGTPGTDTSAEARVLAGEIERLRGDVEAADVRVAEYRSDANLESTGGPGDTSIATQQLSDISTQLGQVRSDRASAQARANEIQRLISSGAAVDTVAEVQSSPLIQRLVENQANIRAQIAQLSSSLLPGHPRIKSLRSQLDDLAQEIRRQAGSIVRGLENQVSILDSNEEELQAELNRLRATAREAETNGATLARLQSEAASLRELLSTYQGRYNQALSRGDQASSPVNARVAANAFPPAEAYFPKVLPMTIAAFIGTLTLGVLWILARELLTGQAMRSVATAPNYQTREEEELEEIIQSIHVPEDDDLGDLDDFEDLEERDAAHADPAFDPEIAAAEAQEPAGDTKPIAEVPAQSEMPEVDIFAPTELAAMLVADGARRVVVTAPQGDVAAHSTIDLARSIVASGGSAVLVDASGTWTGTSSLLGVAEATGLTDILAGRASFAEIIQRDRATALNIVGAGRASLQEAEHGAGRLPMVLDALSDNYDYLIIDCGRATGAGAARTACENAIGVVAASDASMPLLASTVSDMQSAGFQSVPVLDHTRDAAPVSSTNTGSALLDRMAV
ncbi:MAG: exopolysaccharide transport family protein [Pseudomonadota bacterium]